MGRHHGGMEKHFKMGRDHRVHFDLMRMGYGFSMFGGYSIGDMDDEGKMEVNFSIYEEGFSDYREL